MSEPEAKSIAPLPARRFGWRRVLLLALNVALLVFLIRWLSTNIRPAVLVQYLSFIPPWAIVGSVLINLATLPLYGLRMALILGGGFGRSFGIVNIGYGLNTIMPLRLGEAVKIVLAHRIYSIPATRLVMAAFLEKLYDLFAVVLLGLVVIAFGATRYADAGSLAVPAVIALGAAAGFLALRAAATWVERTLPEANRMRRLLLELHAHSGDYPFLRIGSLTIFIWSLNITAIYFTFNTYLGHIGFGALDAVALLVILALAVAVPSTPGSIGLFEAGIVAYLTQFFRVEQEAALAAAVVLHLVIGLPQLALLATVLLRHRMSVLGRTKA